MEYVILSFVWLSYFFLHSLLASTRVKNLFHQLGVSTQVYRIGYSLVSFLLLVIIYFFSATADKVVLWEAKSPLVTYLGLITSTIGLMVIGRAFKSMSLLRFVGLKKDIDDRLVKDGIHQYVRHPIYSGTILIMVGFVLFSNSIQSLIILVTTLIYLPLGIRWEEEKLFDEFGVDYSIYKSKTGGIIPKVRNPFSF